MAALTGSRINVKRSDLVSRFDYWLFGSAALLMLVGLLSLFSVDMGSADQYFKKQVIRVLIGIVPFGVFLLVDPRIWRRYASWLYAINLALLALVLVMGHSGGGAQRWIQFGPIDFQPSELAKLFVVLTLSAFMVSRLDQIRQFSTFALSFVHVLVPMFLIYKQPHLGATLVILVIWLSVCIAAGVRWEYLVAAAAFAALAVVMALHFNLLHGYQEKRLEALKNPNAKGNAYQALRAEIAFGVGGVIGAGFGKGDQKQAHFIPEQQNDFIFTVIGEEGGLIGCTFVLIAFGVFLYRIWLIMVQAEDPFHRLVAAGIFGTLAFHTIVNLGMNLQLLPVVGLWLPFLSYGGTAMWLCMASVALLLNMRTRERPVLY